MPANIYKNQAGKRVPGTTTIIGSNLGWGKNGLIHWAWQQGVDGLDYRESRDSAATTGTLAHAMVEGHLTSTNWESLVPDLSVYTDEQQEEAENAYNAFLEWHDLVKFELLHAEHTIVNEEYQYGGQIDIAAIQSKVSLVDIKTSNSIYPDHKIQLGAYRNLWDTKYPDRPIEQCFILQLGQDGGFAHYMFAKKVIDAGWEAFKHLRVLHDLNKTLK